MVAYCSVKGCNNNSSNKKKNPNDITSFHAFPSNTELKMQWLRAIGRPTWVAPSYARVCSAHFSHEQLNHSGRRIRIKDDAVPVKDLPVNSNFEASHVEVCRFCLATDLRMYSLQGGVYRVYLESIMAYNENYKIDGLPQFICYECAAHLRKCYILLEKSMISQATLLDIFAHNGKISKNLINLRNREELNLTSLLRKSEVNTTSNCNDGSQFINSENNENEYSNSKTQENFVNISKIEVADFEIQYKENDYEDIEVNFQEYKDDNSVTHDDTSEFENDDLSNTADLGSDDDAKPKHFNILEDEKIVATKMKNKQIKRNNNNEGLTPDEVTMQKYFTIVRLSLEEQIEEWNRSKANKESSGESFKCQICYKVFAHHNTYRLHIPSHDPSRGDVECVVCKLRFKNEVLAKSHANRAHAKKFYCKTCPKAFSNVGVAKKHHKWHTGHKYACAQCPFASAHVSALGAHARSQHAAHACGACGRACVSARGLALHAAAAHAGRQDEGDGPRYQCECGLSFRSEGARRVHLLTSNQHKKKTGLCDSTPQDQSLRNTCKKCGVEFPSLGELVEHGKADHGRARKKTSWRLPGDSYPTPCEHCGMEVNSRKEHWWHVRRQHPAARGSYRPVVTAVCHTCGKGFQNSTKLRLHTLRHAPPSVACAACARLFHDKYALARHAAVHAPRAHRCACGRAFRARANLLRHARVHSGVTPYECSMCGKKFKYSTSLNLHVRTIHHRLPHPPRKRSKRKASGDNDT